MVYPTVVVENRSAGVVRVVDVPAVVRVVGGRVTVSVAEPVVEGGMTTASASLRGGREKPPHTMAHNTKTATAIDSHRMNAYLGVGMTRFSYSGVIQAGQKREPSRRVAPQCGHVFTVAYPNVSKLFLNSSSLISMMDIPLQMP